MKRKPPENMDDMSYADHIAVWKAIKKHLPHVAARVTVAATKLYEAKLEVHPLNLKAAMALIEDGFPVNAKTVKRASEWARHDEE